MIPPLAHAPSTSPDPASTPIWLIILVAGIPAVAAIIAAIIAAMSANSARTSEASARRVNELENRLADRKYEMYRPMLDLLRRMLDQQIGQGEVSAEEFQNAASEFSAWVTIYGADEAVIAFQRFMHCTYSNAPAPILLRHYVEFLLAVRRDIGYQDSALTGEHTFGVRFKDLYDPRSFDMVTMPLADLYERENWEAPWAPRD